MTILFGISEKNFETLGKCIFSQIVANKFSIVTTSKHKCFSGGLLHIFAAHISDEDKFDSDGRKVVSKREQGYDESLSQ